MVHVLLNQVDPVRLARKGEKLEGALPLQNFLRLAELLLDNTGVADCALQFTLDNRYRPLVQGSVKAELVMECQRCLGSMSVLIHEQFCLMPVTSTAALKEVPEAYDGIVLSANGQLSLHNLIEEELLLGIPLVVKHPEMCVKIVGDEDGSTKKS